MFSKVNDYTMYIYVNNRFMSKTLQISFTIARTTYTSKERRKKQGPNCSKTKYIGT